MLVRAITLGLCAIALSACAGVTDAYISLPPRPGQPVPATAAQQSESGGKAVPSPPTDTLATALQCDLDCAIAYAETVQDSYRQALINQDRLTRWLGIALIPLGTVALGFGLSGDQTAVMVAGLTGAGLYGTASWLRNPLGQRAYIAGYEANNCAIDAVLPLRAGGPSTAFFQPFETAMKNIDKQIKDTQEKMGLVAQGESTEAKDALATAKVTMASAILARQNGVALQQQRALAADQLINTVRRINSEVDKALTDSAPNLSGLAAILGGLGQAYTSFTAVPTSNLPLKRPPQLAPHEQPVRDLEMATADLAESTRAIADVVNIVNENKPIERLRACGVEPSQFAIPDLVVLPDAVSLTAGKASQATVLISGGRPPYGASLASAVEGLSVVQPGPLSPAVVLQSTTSLKEGAYSLFVTDTTGRQRQVAITVSPSEALPTGTTGVDPFASRPEPERKAIQKALCLAPRGAGRRADGVWGPVTENALSAYQAELDEQVTGRFTEADVSRLVSMSDSDIEKRCKSKWPLVDIADLRGFVIKPKAGAALRVGAPTFDFVRNTVSVPLCYRSIPTSIPTPDAIRQTILEDAEVAQTELPLKSIKIPDNISTCP